MILTNTEEHLTWTPEQIIEAIGNRSNLAFVSRDLTYMHDNIKKRTSFLDDNYATALVNITTRLNIMKLGITSADELPMCEVCGKHKKRILKKEREFSPYCSSKCERADAAKKTQKTWGEQGCPLSRPENREKAYANNHSESARAKKKKTCLERYGVENPMQNKVVSNRLKASLNKTIQERGDEITQLRRQTTLERYGVEHIMKDPEFVKKVFNTYKDRTGYTHPQINPTVRDKTVATCNERYGGDNPMSDPDVIERVKRIWANKTQEELEARQQKSIITSQQNFGVDNPSQSEEIKLKKQQTSLDNYGLPYPSMHPDIRSKMSESHKITRAERGFDIVKARQQTLISKHGSLSKFITEECFLILNNKEELTDMYEKFGGVGIGRKLGCDPATVYRYIHMHDIPIDPNVGTSFAEREIANYIEQELNVPIIRGDRTLLTNKEIDIYIPSHQLAIEFNGLFWHSTKFKDKNYHNSKTIECEQKGVRLIQIFEDEWNDRPEVIKRKLAVTLNKSNLPRVYGRKCKVVEITNKEAREFYDTFHIQGYAAGSTVLALTHNDAVVACMSFRMNYGYMDLIRFATSCQVVGGFSKLFKHFVKTNDVDEIVSFADRRWSVGGVYEKNDFVLDKITPPNYSYVIGNTRVKKQKFRHKHLADMLEVYDPELSETVNTEMNDIWRIYDCGLMRYKWNRK